MLQPKQQRAEIELVAQLVVTGRYKGVGAIDLYEDGLILNHNGISINTKNSIDIWHNWIKEIYYKIYYFNLPIEIDSVNIDLQAFTVISIRSIIQQEQTKEQQTPHSKMKRRG